MILKILFISENLYTSFPTRSEAKVGNGIYDSADNVYEDVTTSSTKKKGKSDGGKKRKGPPKSKDNISHQSDQIRTFILISNQSMLIFSVFDCMIVLA